MDSTATKTAAADPRFYAPMKPILGLMNLATEQPYPFGKESGKFSFGRLSDADLRLIDDPTIRRHEGHLFLSKSGLSVQFSTRVKNPAKVNGLIVNEAALSLGAIIEIGNTRLVAYNEDGPILEADALEYLRFAIAQNGGNKKRAAKAIGMARSAFYRLLDRAEKLEAQRDVPTVLVDSSVLVP